MTSDKPFSSMEHAPEEKPSSNPLWLWLTKGTVLIVLYGFVGVALREIPAFASAITDNHGGLFGLAVFLIVLTLIICVSGNDRHVIDEDDEEEDENEEDDEEEEEEIIECTKCGDCLEEYDPKPFCATCAAKIKYWHDKMNPAPKTPVSENAPAAKTDVTM